MDSLITVMKSCFIINLILTLINCYIREDKYATRICLILMIISFILTIVLITQRNSL